jgi:hypothetical protein
MRLSSPVAATRTWSADDTDAPMLFQMLQREDQLRRELGARVDEQAWEMERMREEVTWNSQG